MTAAGKSPTVDSLAGLTLPEDIVELASLPGPEDTFLPQASQDDLRVITGRFRELLLTLVHPDLWEDGGSSEAIYAYGDSEVFWHLVRVCADYYSYTLYRLSAERGMARVGGDLAASYPLPVADQETEIDERKNPVLAQALAALISHDTCSLQLFTSGLIDDAGFQTGELSVEEDSDFEALSGLRRFLENNSKASGQRRILVDLLFSRALSYRLEVLRRRNEERQAVARKSIAAVSRRELEYLSRRSSLMVNKYGPKKVERVFEQRLSLLFQGFGFTVIAAKPGEEAADLLCISRSEKYSFLVDAKSTRGRYALPKTDHRALRDYAAQFPVMLQDLPRLEMLLVVGNEVAGTVPAKLKLLQAQSGVPARFVPISILCDLREEIPGPVPADIFREEIIRSDVLVDEGIVTGLKRSVEKIVAAYGRFAADLRDAFPP